MLALEGGSIADISALVPAAGTWMGGRELRRLASLGTARRRREFVAGRWLVRGLLERQGAIAPRQRVSLGADGPPRLEGAAGLHLSLAHRGEWVVAAVADRPIGIDIELVGPRDVAAFARHACSASERARLRRMEDAAALTHLHQVWTVKEAAFKSGLSPWAPLEFSRVEVVPEDSGCASAQNGHDDVHAISWLWPGGRIISCAASGLLDRRPRVPWGEAQVSQWRIQGVSTTT